MMIQFFRQLVIIIMMILGQNIIQLNHVIYCILEKHTELEPSKNNDNKHYQPVLFPIESK